MDVTQRRDRSYPIGGAISCLGGSSHCIVTFQSRPFSSSWFSRLGAVTARGNGSQTDIVASNGAAISRIAAQSTYIYRVQRSVWRLPQLLTPPPPLHPAIVSSPRTKDGGGVHTRSAVRGWGVNLSEDARHWIGLLQYNPSTDSSIAYCITSSVLKRSMTAFDEHSL